MRGIIRGSGSVIEGADGKTYRSFVKSWRVRAESDSRNRLTDYEVEFELDAGKVKEGSLVLVKKPKPQKPPAKEKEPEKETKQEKGAEELDGEKEPQPRSTMAERRQASPVLPLIASIPLQTVQSCTLTNMQRPALTRRRPLQDTNRESFGSLKEFFAYIDQGFADNALAETCLFCGMTIHGSGPPQTFRQYYRLDEVRGRMEKLEKALEWKRECTCNGWVFPHPPNNVYRRATDHEHELTVRRYDKAKDKNDYTGLRPRDSLLLLSNVDPAKVDDPKINHLVPKSGGGCPVGVFNLQVHAALCKPCQRLDDLVTAWQSEDKSYHRDLQEREQRRLRNEETARFEEAEMEKRREARRQAQATKETKETKDLPKDSDIH